MPNPQNALAFQRWLAFVIAALFFAFYAFLGIRLTYSPVYQTNNDVFFGADHLEPIKGWIKLTGDFYHEGAHPLVPLLLAPISTALALLLDSNINAVVLLTAFFGAVSVWACTRACQRWVGDPLCALPPVLFFGLSISQQIFAVVPETYAIVGAALAISYLLTIIGLQQPERALSARSLLAWLASGVFTFGILITAFAQTAIGFAGVVWGNISVPRWQRIGQTVLYGLSVAVLVLLLNVLQRQIFPQTVLFLDRNTLGEQSKFVQPDRLWRAPVSTLATVGEHLLLINLLGLPPEPVVRGENPDLFFAYDRLDYDELVPDYGGFGLLALVLWLLLWGDGLLQNARTALGRRYLATFGLMLLSSGVLYSIFNVQEMFLYSTTVTLAVVLLAISPAIARSSLRGIAWWALAACAGAHNLRIWLEFVALLNRT